MFYYTHKFIILLVLLEPPVYNWHNTITKVNILFAFYK